MGDVSNFNIDGTNIPVKDSVARRTVSNSYNGLCPQLPADTTKYLRGDGTWVVPPNTTYGVVSKSANGLCPQLPNETTTTKYLRQDGTWVVPPNTTYSVVSKTANGLCPQLPNETTTTKYLRQDGTWVVPPNTITGTTYNAGSVPNNTTFGTNGSIKNAYDGLNTSKMNKAELIYTNSSSTTAMGATTLTLSKAISNFKFLILKYKIEIRNDSEGNYTNTCIIPITDGTNSDPIRISDFTKNGLLLMRRIDISTGTSLSVNAGQYIGTYAGGNPTTYNSGIIPLRIWGIS